MAMVQHVRVAESERNFGKKVRAVGLTQETEEIVSRGVTRNFETIRYLMRRVRRENEAEDRVRYAPGERFRGGGLGILKYHGTVGRWYFHPVRGNTKIAMTEGYLIVTMALLLEGRPIQTIVRASTQRGIPHELLVNAVQGVVADQEVVVEDEWRREQENGEQIAGINRNEEEPEEEPPALETEGEAEAIERERQEARDMMNGNNPENDDDDENRAQIEEALGWLDLDQNETESETVTRNAEDTGEGDHANEGEENGTEPAHPDEKEEENKEVRSALIRIINFVKNTLRN